MEWIRELGNREEGRGGEDGFAFARLLLVAGFGEGSIVERVALVAGGSKVKQVLVRKTSLVHRKVHTYNMQSADGRAS